MKISGTLTTMSPMTIGAPGDFSVDLSGRYAAKGFPCTKVASWNVPAHSDGGPATFPVVKANTLRGLLRRAGAEIIEKAVVERGERFRLTTYNALRTGAPFGNPDKVVPTVTEIQQAMATPPLAVFGGGPRMIRSALRVDSGVPVVQELVDRGLVPDTLPLPESSNGADSEDADAAAPRSLRSRLISVLFRKRTDDVGTFVDADGAALVLKDHEGAIDDWQTLIGRAAPDAAAGADGAADGASKAETKFRGISSLTAMQVVNPGVTFTFGMDADTSHPASLGYLLLSLEKFAQKQRLGGNGRIGFGRFLLDLTVEFDDGTNAPLFGARHVLDRNQPEIAALVEAAQDWLANVAVADLDALMMPSDKSLQDLRKKLEKSGDEVLTAFDRVTA